ncbi:MAG: tetratricopeptide repeat protein [Candidatus Brocadiales bacterium]
MKRRRGNYLTGFRGDIQVNRIEVVSVVCFLVMAVTGCAQPVPVAEAPPTEVEAPPVIPPPAIPEAIELQTVFSEAEEYVDKGQMEEAAMVYERALGSRPENFKLHYNLGNVYLQSGLVDKAIAEYEKALEINPEDKDLHVNLGIAYSEKGMVDEAIGEYKKSLAIDPNDPEAHYNLGVAYERKGMQVEADGEFDIYQRLTGKSL